MIKNKKAEVEIETIIKIILIVVSFAIIIGAINLLGLTGKIDKESCHASVIARSVPIVSGVTKQAINLRCKTEHVCITLSRSGKGCSAHDVKFQIKPGSELEIQRQIQEEVAGQFFDCWWMLGEGRLNFFDITSWTSRPAHALGTTESACVICSVITFDDEIKSQLLNVDVSSYLETEKIPGKDETFANYFSSDENDALMTRLNSIGTLDTKKEYSMTYMGIKGIDFRKIVVEDIVMAGGAILISNQVPGLSIAVNALLKAAVTTPVGRIISAVIIAGTMTTQYVFTLKSHIAAAAHCEGEEKGCSVLILSEYNAEELGKSCGNIESIP